MVRNLCLPRIRLSVIMMLLLLLSALPGVVHADSLYGSQGKSLFVDRSTRRVGDLVTIIIMENAQATNSTQTTNGKNATAAANVTGVGQVGVKANLGVGDSFKDSGTTSRKGALVARMTARVEEVLPNGDLVISGSRVIVVNNEKQTLIVKGIVRQQDIAPDNTISSGMVGNAEIRYDGSPDWEKKGNMFANLWEGMKYFFNWLF